LTHGVVIDYFVARIEQSVCCVVCVFVSIRMRPIVTDKERGLSVCLPVRRSVCHDCEPCKTAEPIEMSVWMWTWVGRRNHVLEDPHARRGNFEGENGPAQGHVRRSTYSKRLSRRQQRYGVDADWVYYMAVHTGTMADTIETSACGGDTAVCQITLTTCCKKCHRYYCCYCFVTAHCN